MPVAPAQCFASLARGRFRCFRSSFAVQNVVGRDALLAQVTRTKNPTDARSDEWFADRPLHQLKSEIPGLIFMIPASANPESFEQSARPTLRIVDRQRALVTGANSGIGRAIALAVGRAGVHVVVNYVADQSQAEEVVDDIRRDGGEAYAHLADVWLARLMRWIN